MAWVVVSIAMLFAGCCKDAKPGDSCTTGKASCMDKTTELVCQDGKFVTAVCRGPKGCYTEGEKQRCDISANADGDPCPLASEGDAQCAVDKRRMVVCHAGAYALHSCRGPKGCDESGEKVECDKSIQMEGDKCTTDSTYTCSMDKKRSLMCKGGKYVIDEHCRGPAGCNSSGEKIKCDRGPQNIGEPCHKADDYECGTDGKTMMVCQSSKWAVEKKCPGKCASTADKVACE
jgi:hypothetical protein